MWASTRGDRIKLCAAVVLAATLCSCAHDPIVNGVATESIGNWHIEKTTDRITGAPISSAFVTTLAVSRTGELLPPAAQFQLACFKNQAVAFFKFPFKVGSTRNAEFGYRFDDKPGHVGDARFVDDYKSAVIQDPDEMARFVSELTTSNILYVRIRALNEPRTSAEFHVDGAPEAIKAALAGCPVKSMPPTRPAG